ncbi:hypothetical protein LTR20_007109 [Exophiala xenobiotica]|nr:hypothetical protein LTS13_003308 [Exophiala xenobiotica]KAK5393119.1 hypothetical protein LTR79_009432 [Exophiala xenobiotica]KAK5412111.1 hypothetical protein LTR90_007674 [Exophiala xenobiotica]KAK5460682.1 hypothetical protein LTR20_007109 [Exophiala xenobiotica]KAK5481366.1 hypothetical protein LTR26_007203 [Exophiala xenobiotica]
MNHLPVRANQSPVLDFSSQSTSYPTVTKVISTLALLVLGYYALSVFDAWPSTIKRSAYESFIYLFPSPLLHMMQRGMVRLGRLSPEEAKFGRADFGNIFAKQEAVQRIFGPPQIPLVLRKVRSLSGVGEFISLSNDTGPPGLGNWDNSCYQNSVLQGLASLPAFIDYMQHSLEFCEKFQVPAETHRALVAFLEQLADSSCRKTTMWTPKVLKSMDSWQQQDAQEYFSRVLEAAEREANAYIKILKRSSTAGLECLRGTKTNDTKTTFRDLIDQSEASKIDQLQTELSTKPAQLELRNPLDGMTAQALECKTCGFTEGLSLTQFNCLTLNMGLRGDSDVEDLLDEFCAAEEVEGVECENCTKVAYGGDDRKSGDEVESHKPGEERPKKRPPVLRTKAKQITIGRLPKDLVLHLNRSIFDEFGNQLKNTAPVGVPSKLNFLSRWCAPLGNDENTVLASYELKCIVTHYGRHENGHYVALGKRGKDWYSFNDEMVTKITEEEVLGRGNGFMLFYETCPGRPEAWMDRLLNVSVAEAVQEVPQFDSGRTNDGLPEVDTASVGDLESEALDSESAFGESTTYSESSIIASDGSSPIQAPQEAPERRQDIPVLPMRTAIEMSNNGQQNSTGTPVVSPL